MSEQPVNYDLIAFGGEQTVVVEYEPDPRRETSYQSESQLENDLISQLQSQAYQYVPITSETDLVANLRAQLEALNDYRFSDEEWQRFFTERIASAGDGIVEKTVRIQEDYVQTPHPRRRHDEEHHTSRQEQHPQQSAPGHQPVFGRCCDYAQHDG